jgi:YVTN family beta-propeller protein
MKFTRLVLTAFISTLFLASCSKDDDPIQYAPLGSYDSGVIVLNQGGFGGNTTLSYISFDLNTLQNDIYGVVNPSLPALGEFGQDIGFNGSKAYVVLDNADAIEIVNRYTMADIGSITTGMSHPRYIAFANGKAYVSNQADFMSLTDDFVTVYNLATNAVITTIPVPGGSAEKMMVDGTKLYVAQGGEYGTGNKVVVIDTTTDTVSTSITVGDSPNSLQIENGFLWVMCGGNSKYYPFPVTATAGKLMKIDLANNNIVKTYSFPDVSKYPNNFAIYGANGYYNINKDIYKIDLTAPGLPSIPAFTTAAQSPNAFAVKSNHIYVGDATDFNSDGKVYIYSLGAVSGSSPIGTLQKTHTVGITPAGFYFNQ